MGELAVVEVPAENTMDDGNSLEPHRTGALAEVVRAVLNDVQDCFDIHQRVWSRYFQVLVETHITSEHHALPLPGQK